MKRNRGCSPQTSALLAVLLEAPRTWRHGYELAQETELKSGTLYPILVRLSDRKLLESKWEESPEAWRPPRHLYRLTASGVEWAKEQQANEACAGTAERAVRGRA